ncbi:MAG: hypothetical protein QOH01_1358 [Verrucomicrobiota bacterium]|jgi:hypothetical protein
MSTPRFLLFLSILLWPVVSVRATSNYEYGPDEYVTVANAISPDGKIAVTAHGSGELGYENFHLYLTDAVTGKKIGPLEEIKEFLDTAANAFGAQWSSDGQQVTIVWRVDRHEPLKAITYRIAGRAARKIKGPFNVKDGDALEKFFVKECAGDGKPSPKTFGTPLKNN